MKNKDQQIIILNFMFSGDYLEDNIGHEIINMYKSDSKKQYVYLCQDGRFNTATYPIACIKHIVFVRRTEIPHELEILGFTDGSLTYIPVESELQKTVRYGNRTLGEIFSHNNKQQNVNLTFEAENIYRLKPDSSNRYISKKDDKKIFNSSRLLRTYIKSEDDSKDYERLSSIIETIKKQNEYMNLDTLNILEDTELTTTEIYGILNRELSYSNALKFFIDRYPEKFKMFFENISGKNDIGRYVKTFREWRNIDLIVEFEKYVFVIENKIFSKINGVARDESGKIIKDQLDKYYNIINRINEDEKYKEEYDQISYLNLPEDQKLFFVLYPDHNQINHGHNKWTNILYSQLKSFLDEIDDGKDPYLTDFRRSIAYHSESDYNYILMRKRFLRAIKNCHL